MSTSAVARRSPDAATQAGRQLDGFTWALTMPMILGKDAEQCRRAVTGTLVKWTALTRGRELFAAFGMEHPLGDGIAAHLT